MPSEQIDPPNDSRDELDAEVAAIRRGCLTEDVMREWGLLDDDEWKPLNVRMRDA